MGALVIPGVSGRREEWRLWLGGAVAIGLGALLVLAGSAAADSQVSFFHVVAAGTFVAGAALAVGGLSGFLFGVPKSAPPVAGDGGVAASRLQANTALEQISEWLTKVIVGVGLVELGQLPERFTALATAAAAAFGPGVASAGLAGALLIYFGITGFLFVYLWTRIKLTPEFSQVEEAAAQSDEFAEGLMQALLYRPPPDGFTASKRMGEEFVKRDGGNWRVWRALACAYAQEYAYLQAEGGAAADIDEAKKKSLEAVRRVLAIAPGEKQSLRNLWDPALASWHEDDLTVFYNDQDFQAELK